MIEKREKEDIETQIYKDILMSDDHRNKGKKIHKLNTTRKRALHHLNLLALYEVLL